MAGCDLHIRRLPLHATRGLMDHHFAIGQRKALTLCAGCKQECAHARRHAHADSGNIAFDILHGIVNCKPICYGAARAVDIKADILFGILPFQEQHLRYHQACSRLIDLIAEHNDAVVEQAGKNIELPFSPAGLLDYHWY